MEPPQEAADAPLLDRTVLGALRGVPGDDGEAELAGILGLFREAAPALMESLRAALAAGEIRAAERAAHALRGSGLNVGAAALARSVARIEERARRGDLVAARAALGEAEDLFGRTLGAFAA